MVLGGSGRTTAPKLSLLKRCQVRRAPDYQGRSNWEPYEWLLETAGVQAFPGLPADAALGQTTTDRIIGESFFAVNEKAKIAKNVHTEKWGAALATGFQVIPNVLIRAQRYLELDSLDIVIILNLNLHWWSRENLPFPPPALIANRIGVSRRTIERRIHRLQQRGFIKRLPPAGKNGQSRVRKYGLSGLVHRLQDVGVVDQARRSYRMNQSTGTLSAESKRPFSTRLVLKNE